MPERPATNTALTSYHRWLFFFLTVIFIIFFVVVLIVVRVLRRQAHDRDKARVD